MLDGCWLGGFGLLGKISQLNLSLILFNTELQISVFLGVFECNTGIVHRLKFDFVGANFLSSLVIYVVYEVDELVLLTKYSVVVCQPFDNGWVFMVIRNVNVVCPGVVFVWT